MKMKKTKKKIYNWQKKCIIYKAILRLDKKYIINKF